MFRGLIARAWHATRGSVQYRVLRVANATFMVGVTGVVRDERGRVLLLKHRMWPQGRQWGLPSGYALRDEEFGQTVVREVKEETGLDVRTGELLYLGSGFHSRVEVAYGATLVGGTMKLDGFEILDAEWFEPDRLPAELMPAHHDLISRRPGNPTAPTPR